MKTNKISLDTWYNSITGVKLIQLIKKIFTSFKIVLLQNFKTLLPVNKILWIYKLNNNYKEILINATSFKTQLIKFKYNINQYYIKYIIQKFNVSFVKHKFNMKYYFEFIYLFTFNHA